MAPGPSQGGPIQLHQLINDAVAKLRGAHIEEPWLDAELLLAEAAGLTRTQLFTSTPSLAPAQLDHFRELIELRMSRIPLAYILGRREFYSLEFKVSLDVLIPRPETETLVTTALGTIVLRPGARVLDLGTGCGAIAVALAVNAPSAILTATDISTEALAVARTNAALHGVARSIRFIRADCWTVADSGRPLGQFDLIVSNPPYIGEGELAGLEPEVRRYEP